MRAGPPEWYAVSQAAICLGAAWAIFAMHRRGTPVRPGEASVGPARDPGLFWLGLAVTVWGLVGLVLLLPLESTTALALRPLLSSANSACLLISASHLDYGVELLQRAREWPRWRLSAIVGSLAVALVTLALYARFGPTARIAQLPDFALSVATLLLYGVGLFRSFVKRGFLPLAVLACVSVALQAIVQIPEVLDDAPLLAGDRRWELNLVSKVLTLVSFLSLAMSWVHEVARRPSRGIVRLLFTGEQRVGRQNRRRYVVRVGDASLEMRETPHRDLLMLAVRRVTEGEQDGGWIALPDLVGRLDDSRIRRLREDLRPAGLDATVETNFQKSYRLSLPPAHIGFERAALENDRELAPILARLPPTA